MINVQIGNQPGINTSVKPVQIELANLGELKDVSAEDPVDGAILRYDEEEEMWNAIPFPGLTEVDGGTF